MLEIQKTSGTEVWETLELYTAMIRSGVSCEQLGNIIIELTNLASREVYLSEIEKCLGLVSQASELYYRNCTDEVFSLRGTVSPDTTAGHLELATSPELAGELAVLNALLPLIIGGGAAAAFIESGASIYTAHFYTLWTSAGAGLSDELAFYTINKWGIGNLAAAIAAGVVGLIQLASLLVDYLEESAPAFQIPLRPGDRAAYPGGLTFAWHAVENEGWTFQSVTADSGALITSTSRTSGLLTLLGNAHLSISFSEDPYKLTTIPLPTAGGTVRPPGTSYHKPNTVVRLYATSNEGWQFKGWGGDTAGTANPGLVTMDRDDKRVTANFVRVWKVTSKATPSEAGFASPASLEVMDKEVVIFRASENVGFFFERWRDVDSGDVKSDKKAYPLQIIQDVNLVAEFVKGYKLTMLSSPAEGGLTWPLGESYYPEGEEVTITASPAPGYLFKEWTGDASGRSKTAVVTMDTDKAITATFERMTKLTTSVEPAESGSVTPEGVTYYPPGTEVLITATENGLNKFDHFGGGVNLTDNPFTLTLGEEDITVIAVFHGPVKLITSASPAEWGATNPAGETEQQFSSMVRISATSAQKENYYFSNWSGDAEGDANPLDFLMDSDKEVVGNFREFLSLTLNASVGGSVSPSGTSKWRYGATVNITAFEEEGFLFDHWSGDFKGTANPAQFTITDDMEISGVFIEAFYVTISAGEGGTVVPDGKFLFKKGEEVVIRASPDFEYFFSHWEEDASGTDNPITIIVEKETTIMATFEKKKKLTVGVDPIEGGSTSLSGISYHLPDADIMISASPTEAFEFTNWSGDLFRTENPLTVTMTDDLSITANFVETVILRTSVEGEGTISYPPEIKLAKGTEVKIYAVAATDWMLTGWAGDISAPADNPLVFTITEDTSIVAVFKRKYQLTVSVSPALPTGVPGTTLPAGTTDWAEDDIVILSALASKNYAFAYWSGEVVGDIYQNPIIVLMDEDKEVTAHFLKTYHLVTKSTPEDGGSTMPDDSDYLPGTIVQIYPFPATGYKFLYWSGDFIGFSVPAVVVMNSNRSVTAHFGG